MDKILKLNDVLNFSEEEISRTRIRFNMNNGETDPITLYKDNKEKLLDWNYHNNKSYKNNQISVGFVHMGEDRWLLFTIGLITEVLDKPYRNISREGKGGVQVKFKTLEQYDGLFGRLVVKYENKSQNLFRKASELINQLEVFEFLPKEFDDFDFPGYDNVRLSYKELKLIVEGKITSYRKALENQKAVYLITDTNTGNLYVGSASSDDKMLLSRWQSYAKNGHGGNVELKRIVEEKGFDYVKEYFQYSLLEHYDGTKDKDYILKREAYWKKVLDSINHGLNDN